MPFVALALTWLHPFTGCELEGKTDSRVKNCLRDTSSSIWIFFANKVADLLPTDRLWCNKTAILNENKTSIFGLYNPFKMPWITITYDENFFYHLSFFLWILNSFFLFCFVFVFVFDIALLSISLVNTFKASISVK